ncbi:hypothetical protein [Pseudonocardia sp. GCM10023141]|uniref:hypothetical protein n=1 Tax=Pseudonocardia sp. GCM10023141 TaxID=3252653 RepID=UPI003617B6C1
MPDPDLTSRVAEAAPRLTAAVLAHPAVARLDGGPFGTVATYLPGGRIVGLRVTGAGDRLEVAVVARLGIALPQLAAELGVIVQGLLGPVPVDVTVSDVVVPPPTVPPAPDTGGDAPRGRLA